MDFWFDIGMAVILRVMKDRTQLNKFRSALAKLYVELLRLQDRDPLLAKAIKDKLSESA